MNRFNKAIVLLAQGLMLPAAVEWAKVIHEQSPPRTNMAVKAATQLALNCYKFISVL